jgi:hypothetical protein
MHSKLMKVSLGVGECTTGGSGRDFCNTPTETRSDVHSGCVSDQNAPAVHIGVSLGLSVAEVTSRAFKIQFCEDCALKDNLEPNMCKKMGVG